MNTIEKYIRPNILRLKPYSSARSEFTGVASVYLDANESPYGEYNRYPDPMQKEVKKAIAKIKNTREENIFLGNGSDEAIDLCFKVFCEPGKDKALVFTPTYPMYEVMASTYNVEVQKIPLTSDFQIDLEKVKPLLNEKDFKLIFICSPNNPTGNSIDKKSIEFILEQFNGIVVLDEAYIEFSSEPSFISQIEKYPNLIVLQTLSKAWGLAGVRVGMAYANKLTIDYFNNVKWPYNISTPNQKEVLKQLGKLATVQQEIQTLVQEREVLKIELLGLSLVKQVYPSDANFLLVEVENATAVYQELLKKSIIVRNRTEVIKNCLRITIGTPSENQLLLNMLKEI